MYDYKDILTTTIVLLLIVLYPVLYVLVVNLKL